eukprot:scaffold154279_cov36-Cyclotella_meneghiniana.AAC.2
MSGILYRPCSSLTPTNIGSPLHLIRTSVSLCTVKPSLVKIEIVPSSAVLPTLIRDVGKSLKVSACAALADSCGIGNFDWQAGFGSIAFTEIMSVCSGVIGNYNWVIVVVEHSDLTCVCKSYALVLACCLFDQSPDAAGDVVSCILAALPPVLSFSALVMLRLRNALSCCSSCLKMCRMYRLRAFLVFGFVGAATVMSSCSGGSRLLEDVAKA